jgi:hypothetical protein
MLRTTILAIVSALAVLVLPTSVRADDLTTLTVQLSLNQVSFRPGDPLHVSVTVANPGPAVQVNVAAGILLGWGASGCGAGAAAFFTDDFTSVEVRCLASTSIGQLPLVVRNVTLPAGLPAATTDVWSYTVAPTFPPGVYPIFVAVLAAGEPTDPGLTGAGLLAFDVKVATVAWEP